MQRTRRKIFRLLPVLGLISATFGIVVAGQFPASADTSNAWSLTRVAKDVTSIFAAGVGASVSSAEYLPADLSLGPTVAVGIAGSAGFAAGGATKIAGEYLVKKPKSSIRVASLAVIGEDLTSLPANLKSIVKNIVAKIIIRSSR